MASLGLDWMSANTHVISEFQWKSTPRGTTQSSVLQGSWPRAACERFLQVPSANGFP